MIQTAVVAAAALGLGAAAIAATGSSASAANPHRSNHSRPRPSSSTSTTPVATTTTTSPTASPAQQIGLPAYIDAGDTATWKTISSSGAGLGFVIANPDNGPGTSKNTAYQTVMTNTHAAGTKVLGYVDTGYFGTTSPARQTASGQTSEAAWLTQAEQHIDTWYSLYGTAVDGIFFDDAQNVCGPASSSTEYVDLYRQLNTYVHTKHPGALTVDNPGTGVDECYADAADILLTFEGSYADYVAGSHTTPQWQLDGDPKKFLELVYNTPQAFLQTAITRSKKDNAGYVYVTPDNLPNPWDTIPASSYWTAELAAVQAAG